MGSKQAPVVFNLVLLLMSEGKNSLLIPLTWTFPELLQHVNLLRWLQLSLKHPLFRQILSGACKFLSKLWTCFISASEFLPLPVQFYLERTFIIRYVRFNGINDEPLQKLKHLRRKYLRILKKWEVAADDEHEAVTGNKNQWLKIQGE